MSAVGCADEECVMARWRVCVRYSFFAFLFAMGLEEHMRVAILKETYVTVFEQAIHVRSQPSSSAHRFGVFMWMYARACVRE
jgi:hypothetical protein